MKRPLLALAALGSIASAELEVHEWGTFTTLSDSSGSVLSWYSPSSEHSALPTFVRACPVFSKSVMTTVRMETPVLYFYPDQPMQVEVHAELKNGGITEVFPSSLPEKMHLRIAPNRSPSSPTFWQGTLLAPDDRKGLSMIPEVSPDERGAHYAAAREVPDSWIFHHQAKVTDPITKEITLREEADKFIFYRGAGNLPMTLHFSNSDDGSIHLVHQGGHDIASGVLLETQGDQARWSILPSIQKAGNDPTKITTSISGEWQPIDRVEADLTRWFQETLTAEGLSAEEATAMVKTWHGSWFREGGLRAFTIVPRERVDEILPLSITPTPGKLVRVFVHRHELIRREREQELARLVSDPRIPTDEAAARLGRLQLGRFRDAAMTRAASIVQAMAYERYRSLAEKLQVN